MSFTIVEQCTARLNRSELAVPGSSPKFFAKAAEGKADVVFLDLEDAVAPDDKIPARKNIIEALNDLDWSGKTLSVRINGLDTHYMYRDVVDILEKSRQPVTDVVIEIEGQRAEDIPKVFTHIHVRYIVSGAGLDPAKVERAVSLSADKYCSATVMLGASAKVSHEIEIVDSGGS